jgi:hypothetical protein
MDGEDAAEGGFGDSGSENVKEDCVTGCGGTDGEVVEDVEEGFGGSGGVIFSCPGITSPLRNPAFWEVEAGFLFPDFSFWLIVFSTLGSVAGFDEIAFLGFSIASRAVRIFGSSNNCDGGWEPEGTFLAGSGKITFLRFSIAFRTAGVFELPNPSSISYIFR